MAQGSCQNDGFCAAKGGVPGTIPGVSGSEVVTCDILGLSSFLGSKVVVIMAVLSLGGKQSLSLSVALMVSVVHIANKRMSE